LSGGAASPLQSAYPLLLLFLARHATTLSTLAVAVLLTALLGLPLAQASQDGATVWPQALQLALPWLGLAAGLLSRAVAAAPRRKAPEAAVSAPEAVMLPVR